MHILGTLLIGFFAGLLARWLTPGEEKMGCIGTALLGIAGSFAATYAGQALHIYRAGQAAGFIGAVVGAILLLVAGHLIQRAMR